MVLVLISVLPSCQVIKATPSTRPNVLFIAIDDLRPELGSYGAEQVKTPHLDRLAAQGVRFDRAYCQVPVCGASRASLMSSVLPTSERFLTFRARADEEVPWAVTMPEAFKQAGYTTLSNGKLFHYSSDSAEKSWSEKPWRPKQGPFADAKLKQTSEKLSHRKRGKLYESAYVEDGDYFDGKTALKTIEDLRRLKKEGKPFFLGCGFVKPHLPFYAPKKYWDLYKRKELKLADNRYRPKNAPKDLRGSGEFRTYHFGDYKLGTEAFDRMMKHGYLACVSYVDQLVGDILAELDRLGLADNTIVVVWGDHGWHLGEHTFWGKHNTMHLATRVPLIIRRPSGETGVTQALVETSDLFPTLCELAGIEIPNTVQGKSFKPLLNDLSASFREVAYSRFGSGEAVISKQFSYTRYRSGAEMLYDLKSDPDENQNVAVDLNYQHALKKLRTELDARIKEALSAESQ